MDDITPRRPLVAEPYAAAAAAPHRYISSSRWVTVNTTQLYGVRQSIDNCINWYIAPVKIIAKPVHKVTTRRSTREETTSPESEELIQVCQAPSRSLSSTRLHVLWSERVRSHTRCNCWTERWRTAGRCFDPKRAMPFSPTCFFRTVISLCLKFSLQRYMKFLRTWAVQRSVHQSNASPFNARTRLNNQD